MSKLFKVLALTLFAALALSLWLSPSTTGQNNKKGGDPVDPETGSGNVSILAPTEALTTDMDAKTDDLFNNFGARGTPIDECVADAVPPTARGNGRFEDNKFIFEEEETVEDGLGPASRGAAARRSPEQTSRLFLSAALQQAFMPHPTILLWA